MDIAILHYLLNNNNKNINIDDMYKDLCDFCVELHNYKDEFYETCNELKFMNFNIIKDKNILSMTIDKKDEKIINIMEMIKNKKALDVYIDDIDTPLHYVCRIGDLYLMRKIIDNYDIDLNNINLNNETIYDIAKKYNHQDILNFINKKNNVTRRFLGDYIIKMGNYLMFIYIIFKIIFKT